MTSIQSALLILLVVAAIAILLWRWYRSHIFKRASGLARRVFPVWAAQGPFDSGDESAAAMRYAYSAVIGPEEAEGMAEAIAKHAAAYDSDPAACERARLEAARSAGPETEEFVTMAKGLAAMGTLNKEFLADGGHKLELARQPDGSLGMAYKKIWSDEAIEEKKKQDSEAIVSGIGKGLLNDSSEEARALVAFLVDVYKANTGEEAASASAIGRAWLACLEIKNEESESELAQEFEKLNEAHQATMPDSLDNTLEWASNPGAYEAQLIRRNNNPYFPESRRIVSKEELAEAKRMDNDDYILCQERFAQLGKEIEAIPQILPIAEFHKLRERLDDLILFSMGVGGQAKDIASRADQLRDAVISDMRAAFLDDEEALENIEKADTYSKDHVRKFGIPVIAQLLRENSPILKEETLPTILSADPNTIAIFIDTMTEDVRAQIRLAMMKMMQEALDDGYIDPQFEAKLSALEGEWYFKTLSAPSVWADFDEGLAAAQGGDYAAALKELRPLAEQGCAEAQLKLGHMYKMGEGVLLDGAEAVKWYRMAADQGHAEGETHLGAMYHEGQGVPQDFAEALKWFRKAAEQGIALAQAKIGFLYLNGQGVPLDFAEAVKWFRKAAKQGDADARYQLGVMYAEGQGVPQDYAEAVKWVRKAAKQGDADAQYQLGGMYAEGLGVSQDDAEAEKWYRKAAEQGHANAQYTLGFMYAEGQGVPTDDTEVVKWFRKAAEQGMALAQGKIGLMYAKGQGVPQDYVLAHKWINLFAARGDARSDSTAKMLDFLASEMTPAQIAEAQRLAREWTVEFEKQGKK